MSTFHTPFRVFVNVIAACGIALLTACSSGKALSQSRVQRDLPFRTALFKDARSVSSDYTEPSFKCYQDMLWKRTGFLWTIGFPLLPNARAGIILKHPMNFTSKGYEHEWLTLHLQPVDLAKHLKITLYSDRELKFCVETQNTLSEYLVDQMEDWAVLAISRENFITPAGREPGFSWAAISVVEISRVNGDPPETEIEIDHLALVQSQHQYVSLSPHMKTIPQSDAEKAKIKAKAEKETPKSRDELRAPLRPKKTKPLPAEEKGFGAGPVPGWTK